MKAKTVTGSDCSRQGYEFMALQVPDSNSDDYRQRIEEYVAVQVANARKQEILTIYTDLLDGIWQRMAPTLGRMTVVAMVERAQRVTVRHHPILRHIVVTREGIDLTPVGEQMPAASRDELHSTFKEFIINIVDVLVVLTGDVLIRQVVDDFDSGETA